VVASVMRAYAAAAAAAVAAVAARDCEAPSAGCAECRVEERSIGKQRDGLSKGGAGCQLSSYCTDTYVQKM